MNLGDKLKVLLVGKAMAARNRLRSVLKVVSYKSDVQYAPGVAQARGILELGISYDAIVVTASTGVANIKVLLEAPQVVNPTRIPVVVAFDQHLHRLAPTTAELYLAGATGFIAEPYSAEDVASLFQVALSNDQRQNEEARLRQIALFLGKEAASLVDEMAKTRIQQSRSSGRAMPKLKALSEQLSQLFAKDPDLLARSLERAFDESKPFTARVAAKSEREPQMINHPGVDLAVLLSQRGISADALAERISMSVQDIRAILEGKNSIDDACANSLSRLLGGKASDWTTKQSKYDQYVKFLESQAGSTQSL